MGIKKRTREANPNQSTVGPGTKGTRGRPPYQRDERIAAIVQRAKAAKLTDEEVGRIVEMSVPSLLKYYGRELEAGFLTVASQISGKLIERALDGDARAQEFYLARVVGWSEKQQDAPETDSAPVNIGFTLPNGGPGMAVTITRDNLDADE